MPDGLQRCRRNRGGPCGLGVVRGVCRLVYRVWAVGRAGRLRLGLLLSRWRHGGQPKRGGHHLRGGHHRHRAVPGGLVVTGRRFEHFGLHAQRGLLHRIRRIVHACRVRGGQLLHRKRRRRHAGRLCKLLGGRGVACALWLPRQLHGVRRRRVQQRRCGVLAVSAGIQQHWLAGCESRRRCILFAFAGLLRRRRRWRSEHARYLRHRLVLPWRRRCGHAELGGQLDRSGHIGHSTLPGWLHVGG